jgi:hypothetical protein
MIEPTHKPSQQSSPCCECYDSDSHNHFFQFLTGEQTMKYKILITQGITAVLLFGMTFVAGAEQMMLKLPAPTTAPAIVQPSVVTPAGISPAAAQSIAAPAAMQPIAAPTAMQPMAVSPASISPVTKPPTTNTPMSPMTLSPPSQGGGAMHKSLAPPSQNGGKSMILQSPEMACVTNNTPRISSINGTRSGIKFEPGATLSIVGCGFGGYGKGGQAGLYGVAELKIDGWDDATILAHIDPELKGVLDRVGTVKLYVTPSGMPAISSPTAHSFLAAREDVPVALPQALGIYSQIYKDHGWYVDALKTAISPDGKFTTVERNIGYKPFCPEVTNQQTEMVDIWPIDSSIFKPGFEVVGASYQNQTNQTNGVNDTYQDVMVGGKGGAVYDAAQKRVIVTFQGHSTYGKRYIGQPDNFDGPVPGTSICSSRYTVSMTVRGPRGVWPIK